MIAAQSRARELLKGISLMKLSHSLRLVLTLGFSVSAWAGQAPDLGVLSQSGFIMGPGSGEYRINKGWESEVAFMATVDAFDEVVDQVQSIICGTDRNKSVLLVGNPDGVYRYIFARIAARKNSRCGSMWHVEIDANKIEAGHQYVGAVDAYWEDNVLKPSDNKDVTLYFSSLGNLIGIGSHKDDDTGIESEYVANFSAGRIRTVAFMNKYEYNEMIGSKNAYVLNAFAEKLVVPDLAPEKIDMFIQSYLSVLYPTLKLNAPEAAFLYKAIEYYQPNRTEPDRTLSVIKKMIRNLGGIGKNPGIETPVKVDIQSTHPYQSNENSTQIVEYADANQLSLNFDMFETEAAYDTLEIIDDTTGVSLDKFQGRLGAFQTRFYPSNRLKLVFRSDNSNQGQGYSISSVVKLTLPPGEMHPFTMEEVRRAVLDIAQVPEWMMNRDYRVIKELQGKLDGDVVGVAEGKRDLIRLAKQGYVAGRTDEKPVATALLAGPTGTGKSYIAKRFADFLGMRLVTLDMTAYKDPQSFRVFTEVLSRALTNNPYAVYLFEEIDKASIEVLDQLYFMMDEGIFYDNYQRPLFARGAFILMTTNAASDVILRHPNDPKLNEMVQAELMKSFRPSFLNRFDAVSVFKPFSDAEFRQLAGIMASKKAAKIKEFYGWDLSVEDAVLDYIAKFGHSAEFGARPMERLIETVIGGGVAEYQMSVGVIEKDSTAKISKNEGTHDFKIGVTPGSELNYTIDPDHNGGLNVFSTKLRDGSPSAKFIRWLKTQS